MTVKETSLLVSWLGRSSITPGVKRKAQVVGYRADLAKAETHRQSSTFDGLCRHSQNTPDAVAGQRVDVALL